MFGLQHRAFVCSRPNNGTQGHHEENTRYTQSYFALTSGATPAGPLGCECWFSKVESWIPGGTCCVTFKDVAVAWATPRAMLVAVRAGPLQLDVLVGHSPHTWGGPEAAIVFWADLKSRLQRRDKRIPLLALLDSNATVGEQTSEAVGTVAPQKGNPGSEAFME